MLNGFALACQVIGLKKVLLLCRPIINKLKTNHDLIANTFLYFTSVYLFALRFDWIPGFSV